MYTIIPTMIAPKIIESIPAYDVSSELLSVWEIGTIGSSVCPSTTRKLVS